VCVPAEKHCANHTTCHYTSHTETAFYILVNLTHVAISTKTTETNRALITRSAPTVVANQKQTFQLRVGESTWNCASNIAKEIQHSIPDNQKNIDNH